MITSKLTTMPIIPLLNLRRCQSLHRVRNGLNDMSIRIIQVALLLKLFMPGATLCKSVLLQLIRNVSTKLRVKLSDRLQDSHAILSINHKLRNSYASFGIPHCMTPRSALMRLLLLDGQTPIRMLQILQMPPTRRLLPLQPARLVSPLYLFHTLLFRIPPTRNHFITSRLYSQVVLFASRFTRATRYLSPFTAIRLLRLEHAL